MLSTKSGMLITKITIKIIAYLITEPRQHFSTKHIQSTTFIQNEKASFKTIY